jgi:hypothetical protein
MNLINEFALLFAVALPVVVIAGIQVSLLFAGEQGTGLLPGLHRYPSIGLARATAGMSQAPVGSVTMEASNDEMERVAA